jgi:hypothetical protein
MDGSLKDMLSASITIKLFVWFKLTASLQEILNKKHFKIFMLPLCPTFPLLILRESAVNRELDGSTFPG